MVKAPVDLKFCPISKWSSQTIGVTFDSSRSDSIELTMKTAAVCASLAETLISPGFIVFYFQNTRRISTCLDPKPVQFATGSV